jgi:hypothetical protein
MEIRKVQPGDSYPAGLNFEPVPAGGGAPEGRCNFELVVCGTCLDTPGARQAVTKAVELALGVVHMAKQYEEPRIHLG